MELARVLPSKLHLVTIDNITYLHDKNASVTYVAQKVSIDGEECFLLKDVLNEELILPSGSVECELMYPENAAYIISSRKPIDFGKIHAKKGPVLVKVSTDTQSYRF